MNKQYCDVLRSNVKATLCLCVVPLLGRPCPFLNDINNGKVQDWCKQYTRRYGHSCQYSCNGEYRLKGNSTRECQADGTWSGTEPTCERVYPGKYTRISCRSRLLSKVGGELGGGGGGKTFICLSVLKKRREFKQNSAL